MPRISDSKYTVTASWDDVPHLSQSQKDKLLAQTRPHLRDSRSKGIPALGIGSVYTVSEDDFVIPPIQIPPFWRRGYGMDVGWKMTAAIFGAHDLETDILYFTSEHYMAEKQPTIHATAIKARAGNWMPGFIDPAADNRGQDGGEALLQQYRALGLILEKADNSVEPGISEIWERLSTGRLKVFNTCVNWLSEYRIYRRDKHQKIVKAFDHAQDAGRYLSRPTSIERMIVKPVSKIIASRGGHNPYR